MTKGVQVSKKARIGQRVTLGFGTVVGDNVVLGDDSVVEEHCILGRRSPSAAGRPLVIGRGARVRSHSVFYEGSTFGENLVTGHGAVAREDCQAGRDLQIGTHAVLDGGSFGDYVKLHTGVSVGKGSRVGHFVYLFPYVQLTNDPFPPSFICQGVTIEDMAVVAAGSCVLPGVTVGLGAFVGAGSVVRSSVAALQCVAGNPARSFATIDRFISREHGVYHPWTSRFKEKYPKESRALMREIVGRIDGLIAKAGRA